MRKIIFTLWTLMYLIQPTTSRAVGSGAIANQTGVSIKALSHVGFVGVADDPSAVYYNPAGLVHVDGLQLMLGSSFLDFNAEHTTLAGSKDKLKTDTILSLIFT